MLNKQSGFTLVEIVIVIAIIGVLAAVTVVALKPQEIFANGRNSRRVSDVGSMNSSIGQWLAREGLSETDPYTTLGLIGGTIQAINTADGISTADGVAASTVSQLTSAGYLQAIPSDPDGSTEYRIGVDDVANPTHIIVCTGGIEHTSTYPAGTYPNNVFCQSN